MIYCLIILLLLLLYDISISTYLKWKWYNKNFEECFVQSIISYFTIWKYLILFINPFNSFCKIKFYHTPSRSDIFYYIFYKFANNEIIYFKYTIGASYNSINLLRNEYISKKIISGERHLSIFGFPIFFQANIGQIIKRIIIKTIPYNNFQYQNIYFENFKDFLITEQYKNSRRRKFKKLRKL